MAATTLESIEALERAIIAEKRCWLSVRGWKESCALPDAVWRWEKAWREKIIIVDMETAIAIQSTMQPEKESR